MDAYEDIRQVLTRRKLGREEALQLVLTSLIVGGTYPRWGTRNTPTARGAEFLRQLHALVFGEDPASPCEVFVDEFELPRRHEQERSGWPDWAVLWPDRVWMIELKTEAASHRPDQLPHYLDLASHHYPQARIDLTYLTGPLDKPAPPLAVGQRYHHVTWDEVIALVDSVWEDDEPDALAYVGAAQDIVESLSTSWTAWRAEWLSQPAVSESSGDFARGDDLRQLIEATAADGQQRAAEVDAESGEGLEDMRERARELILATPEGSPARHVLPWVWSAQTSGGRALTSSGEMTGAELRLSRYAQPQFST